MRVVSAFHRDAWFLYRYVQCKRRVFSVACANVYMCLIKCMHRVVQLTRMIDDELR